MNTYPWNCTGCHKPVGPNEPTKVFSEYGKHYFFHHNDTCFRNWRIKMLRKELLELEMHSDTLNQHEDWADVRVSNGG
jgi:hypothetical protein